MNLCVHTCLFCGEKSKTDRNQWEAKSQFHYHLSCPSIIKSVLLRKEEEKEETCTIKDVFVEPRCPEFLCHILWNTISSVHRGFFLLERHVCFSDSILSAVFPGHAVQELSLWRGEKKVNKKMLATFFIWTSMRSEFLQQNTLEQAVAKYLTED